MSISIRREVIVACDPSGNEVIVYRLKQAKGQGAIGSNGGAAQYVLENGQQVKFSESGFFEMDNGTCLNPLQR